MVKLVFFLLLMASSMASQTWNPKPEFKTDGSLSGYRLIKVDPGTIWQRLNLKAGDLILEIDDTQLSGPKNDFPLFSILRKKGIHKVTFERNGKRQSTSLENSEDIE